MDKAVCLKSASRSGQIQDCCGLTQQGVSEPVVGLLLVKVIMKKSEFSSIDLWL